MGKPNSHDTAAELASTKDSSSIHPRFIRNSSPPASIWQREKGGSLMSESARDRYTEMVQQGYDAGVIREAPDVDPGGADPSVAEVQNFLKHYGYLDFSEAAALEATPERLDDATVRALTEF